MGLSPSTTYWYRVRSFNGAGDNGQCSNAAAGATTSAPAISLSIVRTFKQEGVKMVDLGWSGAGTTNVDVVRDNVVVSTVTNNGAHTDNIGSKGGGSYIYKICEENSSTACSPNKTATF
jgi:hypothetical protein